MTILSAVHDRSIIRKLIKDVLIDVDLIFVKRHHLIFVKRVFILDLFLLALVLVLFLGVAHLLPIFSESLSSTYRSSAETGLLQAADYFSLHVFHVCMTSYLHPDVFF